MQCHIQLYFDTVWTVWPPKKCVFHIITKSDMVYEYLKTKIFSGDTIVLPQMHWTSNTATTIGGFWVSLNYPALNFKKTVCPKNVWIWHWYVCTYMLCIGPYEDIVTRCLCIIYITGPFNVFTDSCNFFVLRNIFFLLLQELLSLTFSNYLTNQIGYSYHVFS